MYSVDDVPGLESRSVAVDADADLASWGLVSDLGGSVSEVAIPSRSNNTSSDDVAGACSPSEDVRESANGGPGADGLVVCRDLRLSGDEES